MISIQQETEGEKVSQFARDEWAIQDKKVFGKVINWEKEEIKLTAKDDDELLGVLEAEIKGGVMHVENVIITEKRHKQGIGRMLMERAEEIAIEKKCHKMSLETGKHWEAAGFYKKLGFLSVHELENHWAGIDYVVFVKNL